MGMIFFADLYLYNRLLQCFAIINQNPKQDNTYVEILVNCRCTLIIMIGLRN